MNIQTKFRNAAVVLLLIVFGAGCKKANEVIIPPEAAHFNQTSGTYFVGQGVVYKIPVGLTNVSDKDRTVYVSVSSTTGAVQPTQYTFPSTSVIIPAGKAVDSITVQGVYDQYKSGRVDTLVFIIENGKGGIDAVFNDTFRLTLQGACDQGDLNSLLGDYDNTTELFGTTPWGPYHTAIISVNPINATSGEITVENIFDYGWNPITFLLDWSDLNNRTVTLVEQSGIGDAEGLGYSGLDVSVRPYAGKVGTYSVCTGKLTLIMQVGVTGLGFFDDLYTVSMAR